MLTNSILWNLGDYLPSFTIEFRNIAYIGEVMQSIALHQTLNASVLNSLESLVDLHRIGASRRLNSLF